MKLLFTFILSCTLTALVYGQDWAPTGATWYYEIVTLGPYQSYVKYQSIGDTTIIGQPCKIIAGMGGGSGYGYLIGESDTAYTYEASGKIYVYDPNNIGFSLIYDFTADSGNTWTTTWDTCNYLRTILGTDTINVNSHILKTLSYGGSTIIERIGGLRTLFHGLGEVNCVPPDTIIVDGPFIQRLRCYQDSIIGFYSTGISPTCDYTTSIDELLRFENIARIYPNPSNSRIFLQFKIRPTTDFTLDLYSSMGQKLKVFGIRTDFTEIDISELYSGIYFIILNDGKGRQWTKKIIKNTL